MFTQCPECRIAFRVTAQVLQQASGNVRCGNCGQAFNALHYLSEEMPEQPDPANDADDDKLAETSRLLETLNELAGPDDVRIEDTGVEWRVFAEEDREEGQEPVLSQPAVEERRYDDNTPLPDDFEDADENPASAFPRRREADHNLPSEEFATRQGDLALSDPEDWTDILDEFRDPEADSLEVEEELAAIHSQLSTRDQQAGTESPELRSAGIEDGLTDEVRQLDQDDVAAVAADEHHEEDENAVHRTEAGNDLNEEDLEAIFEADAAPADVVDIGLRLAADEPDSEVADIFADDGGDEVVADSGELDPEAVNDDTSASGETIHFVPEPTEEEMTVNMEIDEELMAAARRDEDFTATLVGIENPEELFERNPADVETIIMEGEVIRTAVERERMAAENEARSQLDDPARLVDTYALSREKIRGGRRRYDPPSYVIVSAVAVLGLLLAAQVIHHSRESLATFGFFNQTIAPVYRMLGNPVTPEWDIKGWQFEATNGNVDADETTLTIVSRIANRSTQPLPYPLVHVSLTDRFEDIMGSRILEPGEYLAGDLDPSRPVAPGEDFTAVITIENPSAEATGFKLNVCYRVVPGTVRCAIEDFKN